MSKLRTEPAPVTSRDQLASGKKWTSLSAFMNACMDTSRKPPDAPILKKLRELLRGADLRGEYRKDYRAHLAAKHK